MPWTHYQGNEKLGWLEKFEKREINFLGVIGKLDRGANLEEVNTIIYETFNRTSSRMIQRSGRGKRLAKDQFLHCYYLIPFYITVNGKLKETVVAKWFDEATEKIDLTFIENFTIPCPTPKTSS
jgi:superfamily II DNA or RNA helicase